MRDTACELCMEAINKKHAEEVAELNRQLQMDQEVGKVWESTLIADGDEIRDLKAQIAELKKPPKTPNKYGSGCMGCAQWSDWYDYLKKDFDKLVKAIEEHKKSLTGDDEYCSPSQHTVRVANNTLYKVLKEVT